MESLQTEQIFKTQCQSLECKPLKENVLLASINVILGADSEAKQAGAIASPGFDDKKDQGVYLIDWGQETDCSPEAGPYESSLEA